MRLKTSLLSLCSAVLALAVPSLVYATPMTYDLTLTPDLYSSLGGTGHLTLAHAPSAAGVSVYSSETGGVQDLSFEIDNETFMLAENPGNTIVRFIDGQLDDVVYSALVGGGRTLFLLNTTNAYGFYDIRSGLASFGSISARPEDISAGTSSPVSEPASLLLFGTGLFLCIGLLYRARSPRFASKVHQPEA